MTPSKEPNGDAPKDAAAETPADDSKLIALAAEWQQARDEAKRLYDRRCEIENAAFSEHPELPSLPWPITSDDRSGRTCQYRGLDEIERHFDLFVGFLTKIRKIDEWSGEDRDWWEAQRAEAIEGFKAHRAACEQINERHSFRKAEQEADDADSRVIDLARRIVRDTPATTPAGLAAKLEVAFVESGALEGHQDEWGSEEWSLWACWQDAKRLVTGA